LNCSQSAKDDAATILQLITSKKEMGSELPHIVGDLDDPSFTLEKHMSLLTESQVVQIVGVVAQRFVSIYHIDPWVIKSFRLMRSGKDKLDPFNNEHTISKNDEETSAETKKNPNKRQLKGQSEETEEIKIEETPLVIPAAESANEAVSGRRKRKLCTYYPVSALEKVTHG
jgi:hypothetical protein